MRFFEQQNANDAMRKSARVLMAATITAMVASPGAAQIIRPECTAYISPVERLMFAHEKHRLWYQRFWTGKCRGLSTSFLSDACSENEPGWNAAIDTLVPHAARERNQELIAKACKLGELIGYEWAKDNDVRCIHTFGANSLNTLNAILKGGGDAADRLTRAEAKAKTMCKSLRPPMPR